MKYLDFCEGGLSDTGTYRVECVPPTRSGFITTPAQIGTPTTYYTLRWVVVATGAEAAALLNLSAEVVRLKVTGPK